MRRHTETGKKACKKILKQKEKQKNPCGARAFLLVPVVGLEPTNETQNPFYIKHFLLHDLKIVLHKLFLRKNIAEIIVHHILDRGLTSCHDMSVNSVDHRLVFVPYVVGDIFFRNVKR